VSRITGDEDRRVVLVSLTPKGLEKRQGLEHARHYFFGQVLAEIQVDDRQTITEALDRVSVAIGKVLKNGRVPERT
jgi:DNA-binding MarR family transcriptional regulator